MDNNKPHIEVSFDDNGEPSFEIIPRDKEIEERQKSQIQRVGAYCRVSTLSEQQESSYEQQKLYYSDYVQRRPNWTLVDIYADQGISATSTKRRKAFNQMIADCKSAHITYVITKQVSRFARNTVDCVRICHELKRLDPPVGVFFETEGLYTLSPNSELYLTFMAALAQGESETKSTSMKWAIRSRFERKIPRVTQLYGFSVSKLNTEIAMEPGGIRRAMPHNENIKNVRLLFNWLLEGASILEIQNRLYAMGILSPMGKPKWSYSSIHYVLSNEKYCGNIIMQKTFVEDVLDHKSVKNTGQEPTYILKGVLPAIVSQDEWLAAQRILGTIPLNQRMAKQQEKIGPWDNMFQIEG